MLRNVIWCLIGLIPASFICFFFGRRMLRHFFDFPSHWTDFQFAKGIRYLCTQCFSISLVPVRCGSSEGLPDKWDLCHEFFLDGIYRRDEILAWHNCPAEACWHWYRRLFLSWIAKRWLSSGWWFRRTIYFERWFSNLRWLSSGWRPVKTRPRAKHRYLCRDIIFKQSELLTLVL